MLHQAKGRKFPAPPLKQDGIKGGMVVVVVHSVRDDGKAKSRHITQSFNPFPSMKRMEGLLGQAEARLRGGLN